MCLYPNRVCKCMYFCIHGAIWALTSSSVFFLFLLIPLLSWLVSSGEVLQWLTGTLTPQLSTVKLIGCMCEFTLAWVNFVCGCRTFHALHLWLQAVCVITTSLNIARQSHEIMQLWHSVKLMRETFTHDSPSTKLLKCHRHRAASVNLITTW